MPSGKFLDALRQFVENGGPEKILNLILMIIDATSKKTEEPLMGAVDDPELQNIMALYNEEYGEG